MTFELKQGLIWMSVELEYNNEFCRIDDCILDTGSATTAFDIELIEFDYQKPTIINQLFGIGGGRQEVASQKIAKVIIDTIELSDINIEFEFGNLRESTGINGFIGNDILRQFVVTIDYPRQTIDFKLP